MEKECDEQWEKLEDYCYEDWNKHCEAIDDAWYAQEIDWKTTVTVSETCWDALDENCYDADDYFMDSCKIDAKCMTAINTVGDQCYSEGDYYGVPYSWSDQCEEYDWFGYPYFEIGDSTSALKLNKRK